MERGIKVNKKDGRRLLVTMAELENASQCEYLVRTSTPSTEPGLVGPRPRFTHNLKSPEKDNSDDLHSKINKTYAKISLASGLISFLVDRHKDT
ncbi:unnamed protein product [Schistocephalus solidus]|uniref:Glia maturation factor gamma n=1 Tax=Schistocephalus solidus TaxID=70667 RepID=A0A183T2B5_SCHSO|nr:unnamed protein product [Schistocephalus solidus]